MLPTAMVKYGLELLYAPHHIHQVDGEVVGNPKIPTLESVLADIVSYLGEQIREN
jgi:hypothetical protein